MTTKQELAEVIMLLGAEYDDMKPIEGPRLEMWREALKDFPDGAVKASAVRHLKTSHFAPKLSDIMQGCIAQLPSAWMTADEAWARAPKSEADSAMLTSEISEALGAASSLLDMGDRVAARLAFKAAYDRLTEQAKIECRAPVWFPSFGTEKSQQATMLAEAVQASKIPLQVALDLKPEFATDIIAMVGVKGHPLLAAPKPENVAKLKTMLLTMKGSSHEQN